MTTIDAGKVLQRLRRLADEITEAADNISPTKRTHPAGIMIIWAKRLRTLATDMTRAFEEEPVRWVCRHREGDFNWTTASGTQQGAVSSLMRTGIAGDHGWSAVPLYAAPTFR